MKEKTTALSPTKRALLERMLKLRAKGTALQDGDITPRPQEGPHALSFPQERLWILHRLTPGATNYNVPWALRFSGEINVEALQHAVDRLVQRHAALRTTYEDVSGLPVQVIHPPRSAPIRRHDLSALPLLEREAAAQHLLIELARHPFSLSSDLLLRVDLLELAPREHMALFLTHHIAFDGWSKDICSRELSELYDAHVEGRGPRLPPLSWTYADFAHWQRQVFEEEQLKDQFEYWRRQLAGAEDLLALPTDRPRPAIQSHRGARLPLRIPRPLVSRLQEIAGEEQATLYMALLAAFQTLLFRLGHQEDFLVATPIAGRNRKEFEGIVGCFTNTLPLRADCSGAPTFRELLRRVRRCALDAYDHQDVPFEKLVNETKVARTLSHAPLCQVMFQFQSTPHVALQLKGLRVSPLPLDRGDAKFDLTLSLTEWPDGLGGSFEYATDLFEADTIIRIRGHLMTLLDSIARSPEQKIGRLPILTSAEKDALLHGWNQTKRDYPLDRCLHELFSAQAARTPDAIAVSDAAGTALSYATLDARSNQLARFLSRRGVGPEVPVAVCLHRSVQVAVALLGILKAGGACLPLDPSYPRSRLAQILVDAEAAGTLPVLLTESALSELLPATSANQVLLDDAAVWTTIVREDPAPLATAVRPHNLAYVIFTSGSTGRPKGVQLLHRGIVNTCYGVIEGYRYQPTDRILQFASLAFDAHIEEIFPALLVGATVLFRDQEMAGSATHFNRHVDERHITVLSLPTAFFNEWVRDLERNDLAIAPSVRTLIIGGEQAQAAACATFVRLQRHRHVRLLNVAAPTECTVVSTIYECDATRAVIDVPIGRPMGNVTCYLLDADLQPVPIGVLGEWVVGGPGVARGYLNLRQQAQSVFMPDPFSSEPGARLYRTGDLGRRLPDGNIVLQGRLDHQIKLRGFRIEPGEIESVLLELPAVQACVVLAREDSPGERRLVAYLVPAAQQPRPSDGALRERIAAKLPAYMVPSQYVWLAVLPLSPNGKVDRKALPAPSTGQRAHAHEPPQSGLERSLCELFAAVLRLDVQNIGRSADFFALGGHSLLVLQLVNRAGQLGGVPLLQALDLFRFPTVSALAAELERRTPQTCLVKHSNSHSPGAVVFIPGAGDHFLHGASLAPELGAVAPVFSLISPTQKRGEMQTMEALCAFHLQEILSTIPDGPLVLVGHSFGGLVALELGAQLQACGRVVPQIVLLDTRPKSPGGDSVFDRTAELLKVLAQLGLQLQPPADTPFEDVLAGAGALLARESAIDNVPMDHAAWLRGVIANLEASADLRARWTPRAPKPPTSIHLLLASDADRNEQRSTTAGALSHDLGWSVYLTLASVQTIPGNHRSMLRPPHLTGTMRAIAALLSAPPPPSAEETTACRRQAEPWTRRFGTQPSPPRGRRT